MTPLQADVEFRNEGLVNTASRRIDHRAVLTVLPNGDVSLRSTAGLCDRDPRDKEVRSRRFLCGDAVYRVEPSGGMVAGTVSVQAQVMVRGPRECIQYQTDANGNRTCVRWDAPLETRTRALTQELRVSRLEGHGG